MLMLGRLDSRERSTRARRGAAPNHLAIVLGLSIVLVGGIVFMVGRKGESHATPAHPGRSDPVPSNVTEPTVRDAPLSEVALPPRANADPVPPPPGRAFGPDDYAGRGVLRGELILSPGVLQPNTWTLVLEPHPWLAGAEHAQKKSIAFEHGEHTFEVPDLPLGSYRVHAEVSKVNATDAAVQLVKSSSNQFVTLRLDPPGLIDGRVFADNREPADGLDVVLESKSTQVRMQTRIGPDAAFAFHDVLDGEYLLYLGPAEAPMFPPIDIAFRAPTLRIPDHTLPPTGTLDITALDEGNHTLSDVDVSGSAAPKGVLHVTTDSRGKAIARWLLPGVYRLNATAPDGRRSKSNIAVTAGEPGLVTLHFAAK
jgi:hypothetical protein